MARQKKDGNYLNVRIESSLYSELSHFCEDAGQTKTTAVERALRDYLDNYKRTQKLLKQLEEKDGK